MSMTVAVLQNASIALVISQLAVSYDPKGTSVYVIDEKHIGQQRAVQVGERQRNQVVVRSGLKAGETVVIAGQQKLHEGSRVQVDNHLMPQ